MEKRPYYKAYDDRYRQVHDHNLQWFSSEASPIVREIMDAFSIAEAIKYWKSDAAKDVMRSLC